MVKFDNLLIHHSFRFNRFPLSFTNVELNNSFKVINVIDKDIFYSIYLRLNISGHSNIYKEKWSILSGPHSLFYLIQRDYWCQGRSRGYSNIDLQQLIIYLVKGDCLSMKLICQFYSPAKGSVGHQDFGYPIIQKICSSKFCHFSCPYQENLFSL